MPYYPHSPTTRLRLQVATTIHQVLKTLAFVPGRWPRRPRMAGVNSVGFVRNLPIKRPQTNWTLDASDVCKRLQHNRIENIFSRAKSNNSAVHKNTGCSVKHFIRGARLYCFETLPAAPKLGSRGTANSACKSLAMGLLAEYYVVVQARGRGNVRVLVTAWANLFSFDFSEAGTMGLKSLSRITREGFFAQQEVSRAGCVRTRRCISILLTTREILAGLR